MAIQTIDRGTAGDSGDKFRAGVAFGTCQANDDYLELTKIGSVATFAALASTAATAGQFFETKCHTTGTKGAGTFEAYSATHSATNGVTEINSATTGVRFRKIAYAELSAYDCGAQLDGATDDTVALQLFLTAGLVAVFPVGVTAVISARLDWSLPSSGFTSSGEYHIKMLRASFSQATYASAINTINCGLYALSIDRPILHNCHIYLESGSGIRTAIGMALRGCTSLDVIAPRATGFSEAEFGIITVDSCTDGWCKMGKVTDCTANTNTLGSVQITGLEIDENRISSAYSTGVDFGTWWLKDITLGAAAITAYGYQTDGVTFSGGSTSDTGKGCKFDTIFSENVYEPFDCQSSNNYIGAIIAKNCVYGVKFVHAARNNRIDFASIENTFSFGAVFQGSSTAGETNRGNSIGRLVVRNIGSLGGALVKAAVSFDGASATYKPIDNSVDSLTCYETGTMTYMVYAEAGTRNIVNDAYSDAPVTALVSVTAPAECQVNMRADTYVNVKLNSDTAFANGATLILPTVITDTLSEYGTGTGLFTAKTGGKYVCSVNVRTSNVPAGEFISLRLNENGTEIAMSVTDNDSVAGKEKVCTLTAEFSLTAGQTQKIVVYSTTTRTYTANVPYTSMTIRKIA